MGTFRQISQPLCTILLPTQTTLAFHIPGCPRDLQTSLQVAFPTTKIQSLLFQAASFCQTVFSEQRSHVKPKCLRCMSRATLSQHQNLQQHNNLQWGGSQGPSKRKWPAHLYILWLFLMLRLAATCWVLSYRPSPASPLLQMRRAKPWCSELPLSTEAIMPSRCTNTTCGQPLYSTTSWWNVTPPCLTASEFSEAYNGIEQKEIQ